MFALSARVQSATVVADATGESSALTCVPSEGVCSASHCGGGHENVRALLSPLFAWSAWAQLAIVVAGTTGEGAALASVRLLGVAQLATVLAVKTCNGAALASVHLVGMGSASH